MIMDTLRANSCDYKKIFLSDTPLIDLRAPIEFELGAFPQSVNFPLMNNQEREAIGICYKQKGQDAAIMLGHQLVNGKTKQQRVEYWKTFAEKHSSNGFFYCFRGGLRSRTSQQWLIDSGAHLPIIEGGYKAMRRFLIDETERLIVSLKLLVVTGFTGSAKTELILQQANAIDLEGLANHRGSSFGKRLTPQPTQIGFENSLAIAMLKHENKNSPFLLLEDEGRLIGARSLPLHLKEKMNLSSIIMIDESLQFRVNQIYTDYVEKMMLEFKQQDPEHYQSNYKNFLIDSTLKIKKRLGGVGLKTMLNFIEIATEHSEHENDPIRHRDWIEYLLKNYYDPMYSYQLSKKKDRIIFKGDTLAVNQYILSLENP